MRVAIIDYGSGNLRSATKAFERAAREAGIAATIELTADAERVRTADRIVLPGVGAYADCAAGLKAVAGMWETVEDVAVRKGRPFLGICVGMQLMSERGLEKTVATGFGWIAVARDNLVGTRFHPEKSQALGLALIANFLRWRP
ncbi:MAG: hypothetical protein E5V66_24390 [Mesorhizobium sp.]|uniref:glutamine amidotransferase-related protein n=1 Tax=Mesorhizobium sp. TaxID=1871066 RepID=UPI00121220DD|nr:phosphoribosylformylglycinamidine synthase subunit PurQ [Mesorhizobium sp.]TIW09043.1 MAG: hypothetical protein E5V66_24390 [Mesorhizobium sp.]